MSWKLIFWLIYSQLNDFIKWKLRLHVLLISLLVVLRRHVTFSSSTHNWLLYRLLQIACWESIPWIRSLEARVVVFVSTLKLVFLLSALVLIVFSSCLFDARSLGNLTFLLALSERVVKLKHHHRLLIILVSFLAGDKLRWVPLIFIDCRWSLSENWLRELLGLPSLTLSYWVALVRFVWLIVGKILNLLLLG